MLRVESEDECDLKTRTPWNTTQSSKSKDESHGMPSKIKHQKSFGWEIIEGLKDESTIQCPEASKGVVYRRRKWPMKGWSRLYISLEKGILAFCKTNTRFVKRNFDGTIDLGLAIVSYKAKRQRIDIDAEKTFYHFKVKDPNDFDNMIFRIKAHRLYRQCQLKTNQDFILTRGSDDVESGDSGEDELDTITVDDKINRFMAKTDPNYHPELVRTMTLMEEEDESLIKNSPSFVLLDEDFNLVKKELDKLAISYREIDNHFKSTNHNLSASNPSLNQLNIPTSTPNKSNKSSNTHINRNSSTCTLEYSDRSILEMNKFRTSSQQILLLLQTIRDKLFDETNNVKLQHQNLELKKDGMTFTRLQSQIKDLNLQNKELKNRLNRIKQLSTMTMTMMGPSGLSMSTTDEYLGDTENKKKSRQISAVSATDLFYDAAEFLESDSASSISETEEIYDYELSEAEDEAVSEPEPTKKRTLTLYQQRTGRRDKLPAPQPDISEFSLMNLLCKNIGRDLSKVRLPVILNEPLGVLQLMCEELEYSDLLDASALSTDPVESMEYLLAFAISGYSSSLYRAATKPFNPVIGETFEYIRQDKGWKYVAEQISHHPPVSVAYCESDNWEWMQEFRLKNKFWGKSIEAIPTGRVWVRFKKTGDTVQWNKVTTCIYNIFGQNRYLEHYGDMNFTCSDKSIDSKLTFHKSNWMHQKYEVTGSVSTRKSIPHNGGGATPVGSTAPTSTGPRESRIFGKWTEAVYVGEVGRCIWRPGAMPEDHAMYYGFTKFARDLNNPDLSYTETKYQPSIIRTDSRMRPDQRALEQGLLQEAELEKTRVEELQRKRIDAVGGEENWKPLWFHKDSKSEYWLYNKKYWKESRTNQNLPILW